MRLVNSPALVLVVKVRLTSKQAKAQIEYLMRDFSLQSLGCCRKARSYEHRFMNGRHLKKLQTSIDMQIFPARYRRDKLIEKLFNA
jgi:hypothetical protein